MGTVIVRVGISDLSSVRCRAEIDMSYDDMRQCRDELARINLSGLPAQVRQGLSDALSFAEQQFSSGELNSVAPDPPTVVVVTVLDRTVTVDWEAVPGVESYVVRYGVSDVDLNSPMRIIQDSVAVFNNVAYGKTYKFRIASVDGSVEGDMGAQHDVYVPYPVPSSPSVSWDIVEGKVVLDWGSVQYATGYSIYRDGVLVDGDFVGTHVEYTWQTGEYLVGVSSKNDSGESVRATVTVVVP